MDHPKFLDNPLYIAGDSYTGIVVPIIVQEIYNGNDNGNKPSMNIEGYLEGNPLTDKSSDVNSRVKFAHRVALISDELYEEDNYVYSYTWANDRSVQNALHVREEWQRCNNSIHYVVGAKSSASYTFNVQSTVEYHRNLSEKRCRALIYSGDHDMVVPHVGTEEWIRYTTKYAHNDYELTYATVKGAGHTAPEYKPRQCLAMVSRWFASYPLKSTLVFD
ncbi:unnamed protein product [Ilex paraguariensis]|uniref:Serine carboxypeptidase n=1 Tax=Ilex paraguariensis TaxID=185542 RepID=A0ABC8SMR1_9AQUA